MYTSAKSYSIAWTVELQLKPSEANVPEVLFGPHTAFSPVSTRRDNQLWHQLLRCRNSTYPFWHVSPQYFTRQHPLHAFIRWHGVKTWQIQASERQPSYTGIVRSLVARPCNNDSDLTPSLCAIMDYFLDTSREGSIYPPEYLSYTIVFFNHDKTNWSQLWPCWCFMSTEHS